jgi:putative addiction module component (TIGR02574 family)
VVQRPGGRRGHEPVGGSFELPDVLEDCAGDHEEARVCQRVAARYSTAKSMTEVFQQFQALPKTEQRELAEQIWDEVEADAFVETPALLAELHWRAEEAHWHPEDGVSMEEVRAELRRQHGWK